jgi:hypothetical protein
MSSENSVYRRAVRDLRLTQFGPTVLNPASGKIFNVFRYPSEVGAYDSETQGTEYPHYTMFFITKRQSDARPSEKVNSSIYRPDISNTNRADRNVQAGRLSAEIGVLAGGAQAGASFVKKVAKTFGGRAGPIPTVIGAGAGALTGEVALQSLTSVTQNRERVYLKDVVALYMNNTPSVAYKAYWKDADVGVLASDKFLSAAGSLRTALSQITSGNFMSGLENVGDAAKAALSGVPAAVSAYFLKNVNKSPLGQFGDFEALTSSSLGVAINPFTVQLFKNMGFRTFTYSYVFLPKNIEEFNQVQNIIKTFKKYMHPTRNQSTGGVFLGYPAEFEIQYFYKNVTNDHLFKISNCALTDMKVNYGEGDFVTFKGTNGAPTEITMSLAFTELEILTADRIEEGF